MTLNNLNSRLYYVDPNIIVSDSPSEDCVVLYLRKPNPNWGRIKQILKGIGFKLTTSSITDVEGDEYFKLEAI